MSKIINLSSYAPSIGSENKATEILSIIQETLKTDNVILDFKNVQTMGTNCAKLIFGKLYNSLGSDSFFDRIGIINATPNIRRTIRLGIEFSLGE
jgi:anti-anti-sigma regulatory factor